MRLTCNVEVLNRLFPAASMKKTSKAQHTQLSIGKKPGSGSKDAPLFLMICTAKDRNGTKFVVISYIVQRFCKCNHHTAGFSVRVGTRYFYPLKMLIGTS